MPSLVLRSCYVLVCALSNAGLLDVGADGGTDGEVVGVPEVISEVKFAEPEGDDEGGLCWRKGGGAFEGYCEVRSSMRG